MQISSNEIILRLIVATILSGVIGLERQSRGKPAGIRTHALAGLGAAVMTMSGVIIAGQMQDKGITTATDPSRLASIVIQGIGFIGAGVIIQSRGYVKGLTSAATLWFVGALGIAVGFGLWLMAATTTCLGLILLIVFRRFEEEAERLEHLQETAKGTKIPPALFHLVSPGALKERKKKKTLPR
jgi:putative Mg2+ transporter-C (MgtC) family protein